MAVEAHLTDAGSEIAPEISLDEQQRLVEIAWSDGTADVFHYVWLRHAGRCPGSMPNDTVNKLELLPDDPAQLAIAGFDQSDNVLTIRWSDGDLVTEHALEDLKAGAYGTERRTAQRHAPRLWDASRAAELPVFEASELGEPQALLSLFLAVRDYGLARVVLVPVESGQVVELAKRFGPIYSSNYGTLFDVQTQTNVGMGSNTAGFLGPHTDENYRHAPPGISLFHCLKAAGDGGGASILVDGFMAAQRLKEQDRQAYDVLCSTPVHFRRYALPDEDMRARGRIIATGMDGTLAGIRFTDRTIPAQDLPVDVVEPFYRGLKAYWSLVNDEAAQFRYVMRPGDLHIFDNHRVLHGRTAFDPSEGPRHLQQCSVARDEFHNSLRLLAAQLADPAADLDMAGGALG